MRHVPLRPLLLVFTLVALLLGIARPASTCEMQRPAAPCCPAGQHHGDHGGCGGERALPVMADCGDAAGCLVPVAAQAGTAAASAPRGFAAVVGGGGPDAQPEALATPPSAPASWRQSTIPISAHAPDHAAATAARTWLLTARLRL